MTKQEFCKAIKENIGDYLPTGFEKRGIHLENKLGNGDYERTGIVVPFSGATAAPIIYLERFFEEYQNERSIPDICREIAEQCKNCEKPYEDRILSRWLRDYDEVKEKLTVRIYDTEHNQKLLEGLVHHCFGDFSSAYQVVIYESEYQRQAISVTQEMMESWGVSKRELHEDALFADLNRGVELYSSNEYIEEFFEDRPHKNLLQGWPPKKKEDLEYLYCLTNSYHMKGASLILNPKVLARVSEVMCGDYYVIPSSIDEVMIVPDKGELTVKDLSEMLADANANPAVVSKDSWLSDKVQFYDTGARKLVNAEVHEEMKYSLSVTKAKAI